MRNEILELSFEFALDIIEFAEQLEEKKKFVVANQILKSGTSIGAVYGKVKIAKAVPILYINLKLQQKKQMKPNTGCCCAKNPETIHTIRNYKTKF